MTPAEARGYQEEVVRCFSVGACGGLLAEGQENMLVHFEVQL